MAHLQNEANALMARQQRVVDHIYKGLSSTRMIMDHGGVESQECNIKPGAPVDNCCFHKKNSLLAWGLVVVQAGEQRCAESKEVMHERGYGRRLVGEEAKWMARRCTNQRWCSC